MSAPQQARLARAINATPAEHAALVELATELGSPPVPCPRCGRAMGDGDRVHHGQCGVCVHSGRRAR